jgi:hypothetical protein
MVFGGKVLNGLRKVCDTPMCNESRVSYLFSDMCMFGRHTEYERIMISKV